MSEQNINKEVVYNVNISELKEYENNPRKNEEAVRFVKNSMDNFSYINPIVVDENNVVLAGHTRIKAFLESNKDVVPYIIKVTGMTEEQKNAYRIADNSTAVVAEWDVEKLNIELEKIGNYRVEDFGFNVENIDIDIEQENEQDNSKYTKKINPPIYEPKEETQPDIKSIYSADKYQNLIKEIEKTNIKNEIKEFLRIAATRHIVFNYQQIAEFYAHCNKEEQDLFEKSALVIIDFNKALENGYIQLREKITNQYEVDNNV